MYFAQIPGIGKQAQVSGGFIFLGFHLHICGWGILHIVSIYL
jgi:hypothetical protein